MRVLITGAKGQLGSILTEKISCDKLIGAFSSAQLNIIKQDKVLECIQSLKPDVVINCASYNKVDQAESEHQLAKLVNADAIKYLSEACNQVKSKLVHISTDFVFDGRKSTPYLETDIPNPLNYYGHTKFIGEKYLDKFCEDYLLIRTSWLYSNHHDNFVNIIRRISENNKQIKVINDQVGTPTNAYELADVIIKLIDMDARGLFHCSGEGSCSWYEFAQAILEYKNSLCEVIPISTKGYNQKAVRPQYSVLENKSLKELTGTSIQNWKVSLEKYSKKYK